MTDGEAVKRAVMRGIEKRRSGGVGDGTIVLLQSWSGGTADGFERMVGDSMPPARRWSASMSDAVEPDEAIEEASERAIG